MLRSYACALFDLVAVMLIMAALHWLNPRFAEPNTVNLALAAGVMALARHYRKQAE